MKRFEGLIGHNIDEFTTALSLEVTDEARRRDVYIDRGGGWLLGS
ncbi:hypothetical protein [Agrobacterium rubi]|nr:hypothetical protein [Agrobacterium rubi]